MPIMYVLISRHSHRSYKFELLIICGHFIPMRRSSCFWWKAFSLSVSDPVRSHLTAFIGALAARTRYRNAMHSLADVSSSQPQGPHGTESGNRRHFSSKQVLNVSDQGSKFCCRPPFFCNTVDFTFDVCALCFVDIDIQEPFAQCSWRDLIDFAQVLMIG